MAANTKPEATAFVGRDTNTLLVPGGEQHGSDWRHWFKNPIAVRYGNTVTPLIDGAASFANMYQALKTANDVSHFIYMLNWHLNLDLILSGTLDSKLENVLRDAVNKGVEVRAMLWNDMYKGAGLLIPGFLGGNGWNTAQVGRMNDKNNIPPTAHGDAIAILDDNTLDWGSHHQKILIIFGEDGLIAFCGGIDFNRDRIEQWGGQSGAPMHDVHCRIQGPAAKDLLRIFLNRWYDHPNTPAGSLRGSNIPNTSIIGDVYVQIGRTYGNGTMHGGISNRRHLPYYSFAPQGEQTASEITIHAIRQAKKFIYMENQYLVSLDVMQALRDQLDQIKFLVILIPHTSISDLPQAWQRTKTFIDGLTLNNPNKVAVCYLINPLVRSQCTPQSIPNNMPHTYIHAKTYIIDDEFAIIGSANCSRRCLTHDSEVVAGIFHNPEDENVDKFAHFLRTKLWMEHLNKTYSDVSDPDSVRNEWFNPPTTSKIVRYNQNAGKDSGVNTDTDWNNIYDPNGQ